MITQINILGRFSIKKIHLQLIMDTEVNNCFSIYQTSGELVNEEV